ncbi:MAG TPA: hypothetical protein VH333_19765 [Pseudonocardiaceae bacterium]|nr:hypothetical protein [Pseudonocardiaceae bacterium]
MIRLTTATATISSGMNTEALSPLTSCLPGTMTTSMAAIPV